MHEGEMTKLAAREIVPGDVILLEPGNNIPADCRLLEAFGVRVNNATVTGKSPPKARDAAPSTEEDLLRSTNVLLAGTSMLSGQAKALIFATGAHTEFGKIARLTQTGGEVASPLRRQIRHLSQVIVILAILIGLVFFVIGRAIGVAFWQDLVFTIGIIVAMVPEGLLPTLTLALVLGAQRMAKRKVLMRHLPSVETLGATTVICTDKTGTLTQNRMVVTRLLLGAAIDTTPEDQTVHAHAQHYRPLFLTACLCHDLKSDPTEGDASLLGDPMETSLWMMGKQFLPEVPKWPRVDVTL
jgi:sodium/potassium-transporting ATPase subunit alpha